MPKNGANRAPNGGNGRPKGALNKTTVAVKTAIQLVADGLGGPERMLLWVKEDPINERIFWKDIYPKLLPLQVEGSDGGPVQGVLRIEYVRPKHDSTS